MREDDYRLLVLAVEVFTKDGENYFPEARKLAIRLARFLKRALHALDARTRACNAEHVRNDIKRIATRVTPAHVTLRTNLIQTSSSRGLNDLALTLGGRRGEMPAGMYFDLLHVVKQTETELASRIGRPPTVQHQWLHNFLQRSPNLTRQDVIKAFVECGFDLEQATRYAGRLLQKP